MTNCQLNILIACEFSGTVRDAFVAAGHHAVSCDLLPSERPGEHITGNVLDVINNTWDILIAHPPCRYLTFAANGHWFDPGREEARVAAVRFALALWHAPIPRICLENPLGHLHHVMGPADQHIEPYHFGTPEAKRTFLWLKNLPRLVPTYQVKPIPHHSKTPDGRNGPPHSWCDHKRPKARSRTFPCIALAMASQWQPANLPPLPL